MYEELQAAVKSAAGGGSKNFDRLSPEQKADVLEFVEWLPSTGMTNNTVNSYKSYVTKALLKMDGVIEEPLTNDEKSGARKFLDFIAAR